MEQINETLTLILQILGVIGIILTALQTLKWGNKNQIEATKLKLDVFAKTVEDIVIFINQRMKLDPTITNADAKEMAIEKAFEIIPDNIQFTMEKLDAAIEVAVNKVKVK